MTVGSLEVGELPPSPLLPCAPGFCSPYCQMSSVLGHNDQVPEEPTSGHSQGHMQVYAIVEVWVGGWRWCPSVGDGGLGECPVVGTQELDLGQLGVGVRGGAEGTAEIGKQESMKQHHLPKIKVHA